MKILRLFAIRILFAAVLVASLAIPPEAAALTVSETTNNTASHKTTTKKTTKKTVKKAGKKASKKTAKKSEKKAAKKTSKKVTKKIAKKVTQTAVKPVTKPVAVTDRYVSAAKDGVNVRANPSKDAESLWEVFDKFPLMVKKRQGDWLQITDFEGDTGWIHESLVTAEKSVIVRKQKIHLREDPNSDPNNPIIANVKYGVVFTPVEKNGDWLKVRHADKTEGWLNKDLVWPSDPVD